MVKVLAGTMLGILFAVALIAIAERSTPQAAQQLPVYRASIPNDGRDYVCYTDTQPNEGLAKRCETFDGEQSLRIVVERRKGDGIYVIDGPDLKPVPTPRPGRINDAR